MFPKPVGLDTVAGLPAQPLRGRFYRIVPRHLRQLVLRIEGSELYGGRYNPKGAFGALYCCGRPDVCVAEVRKATAGRALGPFVLVSVKIELQRVLDLTDPVVLERLGLRPEHLVAPDWTPTQELGRLAREAGFEALLVPSATATGANLVVFKDRLSSGSSLRPLKIRPAKI